MPSPIKPISTISARSDEATDHLLCRLHNVNDPVDVVGGVNDRTAANNGDGISGLIDDVCL